MASAVARRRAARRVGRTQVAGRAAHRRCGGTVVGFPLRAPTVPQRRRGAPHEPAHGRRRLRHRVGPAPPGPRRPRAARRRAAAPRRVGAWPTPSVQGLDRLEDLRQHRGPGPGDLRRQPPQPPRHAAAAHGHPRAVAPPARRRRRGRLLLRHPGHGDGRRPSPSAPSRSSARRSTAARPTSPPTSSTTAGAC